ncbi:tetraprenyl-beta-curcumene synthase family protein [Moorella naiadis]|uniref:tetraprenyl-beta-curcumene synthase family protein n=1 Tax=Moorella naiadis (nom. illeg.) TaxID=3093670 RepID=UPI003D9CB81D
MPNSYAAAIIVTPFLTLTSFLGRAFPGVNRELAGWRRQAAAIPDLHLREQALTSLALKKFHCQGGSVYAVWPRRYRRELLRAIVSLQTISDYLDNLCDRAGVLAGESFRQLHLAFTDALIPGGASHDYYAAYPYQRDGGYLQALVQACRASLAALPGYARVQEEVLYLAALYCRLQVTKHIEPGKRQEELQAWLRPLLDQISARLYWWELAAATGSTLGIFALMALAAREEVREQEAVRVREAYFPWIGGLHILLDYLIDQEEDRAGGDLNFCAFYREGTEAGRRLSYFWQESLAAARQLPDPAFHLLVVRGLPALYLSDTKASQEDQLPVRQVILQTAGPFTRRLYRLCRGLRWAGIV